MPRNNSKRNRNADAASQLYDPNTETDQSTRNAALRWELLRRNMVFNELSRRWIADAIFRLTHSESRDYHHSAVHFPRCVLDWMISGPARVKLARGQLAAGRWFVDNRFNFGPIVVSPTLHPLDVRRDAIPSAVTVRPLPDAPQPVQLEQIWPATPQAFRQQFILALDDDARFQAITQQIREAGDYLQWAASRLYRNDAPEKLPQIIQQLMEFSRYFQDLAEFHQVFAVPNAQCGPKKFKEYLNSIRKHCSEAGQIEGRYSAHKSWLGTTDQWRYFLIAEQKGYDTANEPDMYELARVYSEVIRHRRHDGTARRDAKPHGFKGDAVPSKVIKSRRPTVRGFVTAIQEWIANIYPTDRWLATTRPTVRKLSGKISPTS